MFEISHQPRFFFSLEVYRTKIVACCVRLYCFTSDCYKCLNLTIFYVYNKRDWLYTVLCWCTESEKLVLRWKCKCAKESKSLQLSDPPTLAPLTLQLQICLLLIAWTSCGDVMLKTCQLSTWQRQPRIIFVIFQPDKQTINSVSSDFFSNLWWRLAQFLLPQSKCVTKDLWRLIAVTLPFSITEYSLCCSPFRLNFWLRNWAVSMNSSLPHLTPASTPGYKTLPAVLLSREREIRKGEKKSLCWSLTLLSDPGQYFLTPHGQQQLWCLTLINLLAAFPKAVICLSCLHLPQNNELLM